MLADRYDLNEKFHSQTKRFPARAAGSMTTSAEDLARFATALCDGTILKPATRAEMLTPVYRIHSLHEFALAANEGDGTEAAATELAYGGGWGLLKKTPSGFAFFREGRGVAA